MRDRPILTRAFLLLTAAHMLASVGYASMVLLPLYLDHLHATRSEIGFIMSIAFVGGVLLRPVVGWALDRFGRKSTLVLGTVLLSASMCSFWFVTSLSPLVYAVRIFFGIGTGAIFTGYFTLASDLIPDHRRTEGLALFGISGLIPLLLNPIAGVAGIESGQLRPLFTGLGLLVLASLVPLLGVRETPKKSDAPRMTAAAALDAIRRRSLFSVWIATIGLSGLVATFMAFATVTAEHRNISDPPIIWLTYAGGAIAIRFFGSSLLDRAGAVRMVPTSLAIYGAAFVTTALAGSTFAFLAGALLAGAGHGLGFPVLASQIVRRIPDHLRGSGVAALTALWETSAVVVTPIFGAIADGWSDAVLFYAGAVFALVCMVVWWPLESGLSEKSV